MSNETVRKNITMSKEVAAWIEARSKKYGMAQSSIVVMAIAEYIRNENTVNAMENLPDIMGKLQDIQKKQAELQGEAPWPAVEPL